jgi:hypothetical protein
MCQNQQSLNLKSFNNLLEYREVKYYLKKEYMINPVSRSTAKRLNAQRLKIENLGIYTKNKFIES